MSNYDNLLTRLDAGYTKPIATLLEFAEAAAAIRELQGIIEIKTSNFMENHAKHLISLKQLAEREATIQKLREALKVATSICWSNFSEAQEVVLEEALSLPSPTEHLSQYRDAVIEECIKTCQVLHYDDYCALKAMKGKP